MGLDCIVPFVGGISPRLAGCEAQPRPGRAADVQVLTEQQKRGTSQKLTKSNSGRNNHRRKEKLGKGKEGASQKSTGKKKYENKKGEGKSMKGKKGEERTRRWEKGAVQRREEVMKGKREKTKNRQSKRWGEKEEK